MKDTKYSAFVPFYCFGTLVLFVVILLITPTRQAFETVTQAYPYGMGFVKFALLALCGELLAKRISEKSWSVPNAVLVRFFLWGLIGIWITYMMKINSAGVGALMQAGLLPGGNHKFLKALFTSITMNLTFAPTFMAVHKCSDCWLDLKTRQLSYTVKDIVQSIDWISFVKFTLFRTIPLFWIPAHTVTFLLPETYQVMLAAMLSVALGIILSMKTKQKA